MEGILELTESLTRTNLTSLHSSTPFTAVVHVSRKDRLHEADKTSHSHSEILKANTQSQCYSPTSRVSFLQARF